MVRPGDAYDWLHYWDAYKSALKSLVADGDIRGVFWTEELALVKMLPTEVLPHIHALIEADSVDADIQAKLHQRVTQQLDGALEEHLPPNTKVCSIKSQASLFHHIRYMIKPIDLVKAYDFAWPQAQSHNRHLAQSLNSQMSELVQGFSLVTIDRRKLNSKGNLNACTKNYIGVRKKNHAKHRECLKQLNEAKREYIQTPETEEMSLTA